jgi:mobilome CxxCx(11)CxxC protein
VPPEPAPAPEVTAAAVKELESLKEHAWNSSFHDYATAYIFQVRARRMERILNVVTFVGLFAPLAVGLIVLGFGTKFVAFDWVIWTAVGISFAQTAVFLWSVIAKWQDRYQVADQALKANTLLSEKYEKLAKEDPEKSAEAIKDYKRRLELLDVSDEEQKKMDLGQKINDEEKHMGMRAGLLQKGSECSKCHITPPNMKPTKCGTCGDFPKWWVW